MTDDNDLVLSKNSLAREFFDCGYDQLTDSRKALIDARFEQLSRPQLQRQADRPTVLSCTECQSVHFNVARPGQFSDIWKVCCEGCGSIYDLLPNGDVQLHSR